MTGTDEGEPRFHETCPGQRVSSFEMHARSAFDLLHYKGVDVDRLLPLVPGLDALSPTVIERVGIAGK